MDPATRSFKKGGRHQRALTDDALHGRAASNVRMESALAQYLLSQYVWGWMTPQEVQRVAMHARDDMRMLTGQTSTLPEVEGLAALGAEGKYPNNVRSQLYDHYLNATRVSEPTPVSMPMMSLNQELNARTQQHIYFPHVVFSSIYHQYPGAFKENICPSMEALQNFWAEVENSPQMLNHPIRDVDNFRTRAIPISLHGDGVPVSGIGKTWGKSLDVYSWNSLLCNSGKTISFTYYIWSIFQKLVCHRYLFRTKHKFWRMMVWSLEICMRGEWPTHDWNGNAVTDPLHVLMQGRPLAGAVATCFVLVVWVLRGDLEWQQNELLMARFNRNDRCCSHCPADHTNAFEFRDGRSPWRPRIYNKLTWRATEFCSHLLFQSPLLGLSILSVAADWMHCKNLGIDTRLYGSVLFMLCYELLPGDM